MVEISEFVDETRESILQKHEVTESRESLSETLTFVTRSAHRVGLGLLYVGDESTARSWFGSLSPAWLDNAAPKWEFVFEQGKRIDRLPWLQLYRALGSAVLSGDAAIVESSATRVWELATASELEELPGQDHAIRPWIVRGFAALLLGRDDVPTYVEEARARYSDDRYDRAYLGSQVDAIEAIHDGDEAAVTAAIEQGLAFHEASFTDNEDMHFVQEAVSADACTFVVLARQRGLDVRVDSEYVPEAVYELA